MSSINFNSIDSFKQNFGGGTRSNRFSVTASFPNDIDVSDDEIDFKIFATSLPKSEVGTIQVGYRGRSLNFAGDRAYGTWEIAVYDDNNSDNLWRAFHKWKDKLDGYKTHIADTNDFSFTSLKKTWTVKQLGLNGALIREIEMIGCWPNVVGSIMLDQSSQNQVTFNVSMLFDYFKIKTSN
jgi:hypothetical protein